MATKEVKAQDLQVGMVLVAKFGEKTRYRLTEKVAGMGGKKFPYLILTDLSTGERAEHDTYWSGHSATFTVEVEE